MVVGHVKKSHGTKGELYVQALTDHPDRSFAAGVVVRPAGADDQSPDPDLPPLRIEAARPYKKGWLVTFGGVEDRNAADLLRGRYLVRPFDELEEPEEDEVFYHDLVGMRVETVDGTDVGRVTEVYELVPADMLQVRGGKGIVLIPFARHVVVELDREGGRIVIDPPEGLLEL